MHQETAKNVLAALAKLETLRDPQTHSSEREFRRVVVRGEADLSAIGDQTWNQTPIRAQLRDVSWGGLGFVCQEPLIAGSLWRASFLSHHFVVATQTLIVRHCSGVQAGLYLIGSEFCADPGLLYLLGVDPAGMKQSSLGDAPALGSFQAPGEVA